jgi:hypothetical protein
MGFDVEKVKLPKRYFETESMNGMLDEEAAYEMIRMYNQKTKDLMKEA